MHNIMNALANFVTDTTKGAYNVTWWNRIGLYLKELTGKPSTS